MQKIFLLGMLTFFTSILFSQPADCLKFKDGKFKTTNPYLGDITIADRKGGYQTESSEALKLIVRFKVMWSSNCSLILTLDKIIRNENKINVPANLVISIKIIATSGNTYTQETTSSFNSAQYKFDVVKIE